MEITNILKAWAKLPMKVQSLTTPSLLNITTPSELSPAGPWKSFFKFATCYWHTFCGTGADPFGPGPQRREWNEGADAITRAYKKMDAAFEFFTKIGTPYYCFHDIDMVEEGANRHETQERLFTVVERAKEKNEGIRR
ncbi:MAG: hypothetical protein NVV73_10865 [Cellvibrionaceae bacterium]|nr:hypothetical protein [Cellvibrionaceae bacterium]